MFLLSFNVGLKQFESNNSKKTRFFRKDKQINRVRYIEYSYCHLMYVLNNTNQTIPRRDGVSRLEELSN